MMKKLIDQMIKFGAVGILATLIDYGILFLLTEFVGMYYLLSACLSFIISLIFNYLCSMKFVFERREDIGRRREFLVFVVLSLIGLLMNEIMMWLGVNQLHLHYMLTKIFATAVVMVWNFISRKVCLEKKQDMP